MLDSSESAKDNHEREKQFAVNVVESLQGIQLQTGRRLGLRVALLQYSSHVITEQTFREWRGADNFKTRIAPIVYIGHGTYTTYAITNMTTLYLEESNLGSIKIAVLLTEGVFHPRNPDIFSAVADAKNQGIRFFTVGITRSARESANVERLRLIASSPTSHFLHNLQDENIVKKIVSEIVSKMPIVKAPRTKCALLGTRKHTLICSVRDNDSTLPDLHLSCLSTSLPSCIVHRAPCFIQFINALCKMIWGYPSL